MSLKLAVRVIGKISERMINLGKLMVEEKKSKTWGNREMQGKTYFYKELVRLCTE